MLDLLSFAALADAAAEILAAETERAAREGAVRDIDALLELPLVDVLAAGLRSRGLVVERERRYPVFGGRAKKSQGLRCDLVVKEAGASDDDALWLEVKRGAEHVEASVRRGLFSRLSGAAAADIAKLASDRGVPRGALLLVVYAADAASCEGAVAASTHRCLDEGLPIEHPYLRRVSLGDLMGNAVCIIAVIPVRPAR